MNKIERKVLQRRWWPAGVSCVCLLVYLGLPQYQLSPALPLRTLVPLSEGGLIGRPAALLVVEPHGAQTHALLQVVHPISSNVNQASQSTWQEDGGKGGGRGGEGRKWRRREKRQRQLAS